MVPHRRLIGVLGRALGVDHLEEAEHAAVVRWGLAFALVAMGLRVFFWAYTHRLWEDALITVLHSENFWSGLGLTHVRPGEAPLHGFTSPLSVLIPMVGDAARVGWGISFFKIVSVFASGLTVIYALGIAVHPRVRLPLPAAVLVFGYLACEHHQILWGMAGMETQVITAILFASIYFLIAWKPVPLGVTLGLCMLARPDFAFWTVVVGCFVLARDWRVLPKVAGIALLVYAPWVLFTLVYYGSPIPNTVYAKGMSNPLWWTRDGLVLSDVKREIWDRVTGTYQPNTIFQALGPSFAGHGTHFRPVVNDSGAISEFMTLLAVVGALVAHWRCERVWWPVAAFVVIYTAYYVFLVSFVHGWYVAPFVAVTALLCAKGLASATGLTRNQRVRSAGAWGFTGLCLAWVIGLLPLTMHTEKLIQQLIEDPVRRAAGEYLGEVMQPGEWIGCEPLGYISYFSRKPVYDWPGLANRRVVEFQREHPAERNMYAMFRHFEPEYLFLRPYEISYMPDEDKAWFAERYVLDREFSVPPEVRAKIFLVLRNPDYVYFVYKKY